MSIKEFILSLFWKIFLLGVEFYTDFFFPFQNFKHTAQFYSQSPYFWKQSAVIFMLLHLYAMYLFSLATLKLYYFHWFWATWLWCAFVPFFFFFSCFLCLRFVELLGSVGLISSNLEIFEPPFFRYFPFLRLFLLSLETPFPLICGCFKFSYSSLPWC